MKIEELRRLAEAATPGPWSRGGVTIEALHIVAYGAPIGERCIADITDYRAKRLEDATFIAAANPAAILALLDRLEKLERINETAWGFRVHGVAKDGTHAKILWKAMDDAADALEAK